MLFRTPRTMLAALWIAASMIQTVSAQSTPTPSSYTLDLDTFATHTSGTYAMDVVAPKDGSGRVFLSTLTGQIEAFDAAGNSLGTFLNVNPTVATTNYVPNTTNRTFKGLNYFDFHPDYANVGSDGFGKIYTGFEVAIGSSTPDYTSNGATGSGVTTEMVIGEWTVDAGNANQIDTGSYREVFRLAFQADGDGPHAIGQIAFNPWAKTGDDDYGLLYAAIGDSNTGNHNPASGYIQNIDNPFGTIIRIDPIQNGGDAYSIPDANPFAGQSGAAEEIYAYGFRDPQTFSFAKDGDGQTVVVTFDIGAADREEISLVRNGGNYGWDRYEGTSDLNPGRPLVAGSTHAPPVVEYDHSTGFAIIGGLVVSDPDDPTFQRQVIFGDLPTGKMFHADYDAMLAAELAGTQAPIFEMLVDIGGVVGNFVDLVDGSAGGRGDARFGFDEAGNVYIVSEETNTIFETGLVLVDFAAPAPAALPAGLILMASLAGRRRREFSPH